MGRSPVTNAAELPTCIYCRATGVPFNRDHVIPEAFGMFKHNFVLTCVCTSCNDFYGDELELVLGRNSREAILRLYNGVKTPASTPQLEYENAELTVNEPGPWRGAQIRLAADPTGTKLDTQPLPQVAFKNQGQAEWTWLPEASLTDDSIVDPYRKSTALIQIVGPSQDDWNRQGDGLFAQVSLFNDLNYRILMCPRYSGLVRDTRSGHHFDLQSRTISALGAVTLNS